MFQEVTDTVILFILVDRAGLDEDLYGRGVTVFDRSKEDGDSGYDFCLIVHTRSVEAIKRINVET